MCDSKAGQDVFMLIKLFADQIRIMQFMCVAARVLSNTYDLQYVEKLSF